MSIWNDVLIQYTEYTTIIYISVREGNGAALGQRFTMGRTTLEWTAGTSV